MVQVVEPLAAVGVAAAVLVPVDCEPIARAFNPSEPYRIQAGRAGVKRFYKYAPDLWTSGEVLRLDPPPDVVIYQ